MNIKKVLTNQYIYSIATKIVIVAIGFLNSMVLARYLGPELKGMAVTAVNYANIFSIVITFGLQEAYPFFRKKHAKKIFLSEFMSLVIALFGLYALISITVFWVVKPPVEVIACIIVTLVMGYALIVNYVALVESPNKRNSAMAVMYIVDFAVLLFMYVFIPQSYIIAIFLTALVFMMQALYYSLAMKFKFDLKFIKMKDVWEYTKFGLFPMIALLLTTLNYRVDVIMLRAAPEISYAQIGVYSVGVSLAEKVFMIPNAVKEILLSKLANGKSGDEVCKTIRMCWPICLLSTVVIIIFGKPFVNLFYGEVYNNAYSITAICVFGTVFMIFFKMISTYNVANGKQKVNLLLLLIADVINILLNALLIPQYGTNGAAIASDVSYFICAVMFVAYFCKVEQISLKKVLCLRKEDFTFIKN